jgi:hypothetical protein
VILPSRRRSILHQCILRLDRRPQGGGRGAPILPVDFGGGNIVDEVDGIVNNDVALHPFSKIWIFDFDLDFAAKFLTPSRVESILKFSLDKADTAIDG